MTNEWTKPEHAEAYLARMKDIPHRADGEAMLLSEVPPPSKRVLDLGCGNGHLLSLVLAHCPTATGVGLDLSPTMLGQARDRFRGDDRVRLVEHNMDELLPDLGSFDCVVSSFAIHHCIHERKRELYTEAFWSRKAGAGRASAVDCWRKLSEMHATGVASAPAFGQIDDYPSGNTLHFM